MRPEDVSDDDVITENYLYGKAQYAKQIGRDVSDEEFMAANRPDSGQPARPDTNFAEDFRQFYVRNTNTGKVGIPGTDARVDPGRIAADGIAPQLGVGAAAKALGTKAPGMLHVGTALDVLDQGGLNPFSDRFGKGGLGHAEVVQSAEQHAAMPVWANVLTSATKPITTIREGGELGYEAAGDMGSAVVGSWNQDEKWRAWAAGQREKFQAEAGSPDPAVAANAKARLAQIEAGMKQREGSAVQNVYHNTAKPVAKPFDVAQGNFYMPWQDTNNSKTVGQTVSDMIPERPSWARW